jgi:hypothetical protein
VKMFVKSLKFEKKNDGFFGAKRERKEREWLFCVCVFLIKSYAMFFF